MFAPCHVCGKQTKFLLVTDEDDKKNWWMCSECCYREEANLGDDEE